MASTKVFTDGVRSLNDQLWLLMASTEQLQGVAHGLTPLQNRPIGPPNKLRPHNVDTVLGTLMPFSKRWAPKIHLHNHKFAEDLRVLAKDCETWLPGYFLILAKSLAEGFLVDALSALVARSPTAKANLDVFCKQPKRPAKKAIEVCVQGGVRGIYDDLDRVVRLGVIRAQLDTLTGALSAFATVRNELAHRLAPHITPTVTTAKLAEYIARLTDLVELLAPLL
jgi:hypothetical protein